MKQFEKEKITRFWYRNLMERVNLGDQEEDRRKILK
jgi:hypothetical protein